MQKEKKMKMGKREKFVKEKLQNKKEIGDDRNLIKGKLVKRKIWENGFLGKWK